MTFNNLMQAKPLRTELQGSNQNKTVNKVKTHLFFNISLFSIRLKISVSRSFSVRLANLARSSSSPISWSSYPSLNSSSESESESDTSPSSGSEFLAASARLPLCESESDDIESRFGFFLLFFDEVSLSEPESDSEEDLGERFFLLFFLESLWISCNRFGEETIF